LTAILNFYSFRILVQGTTGCGVSHKKYTHNQYNIKICYIFYITYSNVTLRPLYTAVNSNMSYF